jgi:hypothetical protein
MDMFSVVIALAVSCTSMFWRRDRISEPFSLPLPAIQPANYHEKQKLEDRGVDHERELTSHSHSNASARRRSKVGQYGRSIATGGNVAAPAISVLPERQ